MSESAPRSARQLRPMLIGLGVLALIGIALTFQNSILKNRNKAKLDLIRAAGLPVDLFELDESYEIPSGATNAADIYQDAFASMIDMDRGNTNSPYRIKLKEPHLSYPQPTIDYLKAWTGSNSTAIALLHQGADHSHARYPQDYTLGYSALLPHLGPLKGAVQLLTYHACLQGESGSFNDAIVSLETSMSLAESLNNEPEIIGQLVRMAAHQIIVNTIEHILNHHALSDAHLKRLFRLLEGRESPEPLVSGFSGEMCMGLSFFEDPQSVGGLGAAGVFNAGSGIGSKMASGAILTALQTSGLWERDKNFFIDAYSGYRAALHSHFPAALKKAERVNQTVQTSRRGIRNLVSRVILPAISRVIEKEAHRIAALRTTQTGIAIERYRLAHDGTPPEKLTELVPHFLPSLLEDPFDGKPLRYRQFEGGYVTWSIGKDQEDNQGDLRPIKKTPKDVRFRMLCNTKEPTP